MPTSGRDGHKLTRALVAVVAAVVLALAAIGIAYVQPLSKVNIHARNICWADACFSAWIDDNIEPVDGTLEYSNKYSEQYQLIGSLSVAAGSHCIKVDCHYLGSMATNFDGVPEYFLNFSVLPFGTKDVYLTVDPELPQLTGDLTLFYSYVPSQVTIEGKVYNLSNSRCHGTLSFNVQDSRGWSMSGTIALGEVGANGDSVVVSETYEWPFLYNGEGVLDVTPTWGYSLSYY